MITNCNLKRNSIKSYYPEEMDPTMKHQFDENQRKILKQEVATLNNQGKMIMRINKNFIYYVE